MRAHLARQRAMKDRSRQNWQGKPEEDFSEFGEVRVISRPVPDAEDRLRRLFTLLLEHAARERRAASEKHPLADSRPAEDHIETEA